MAVVSTEPMSWPFFVCTLGNSAVEVVSMQLTAIASKMYTLRQYIVVRSQVDGVHCLGRNRFHVAKSTRYA